MASIVPMANQTADCVQDRAADRGLSRSGGLCVGVDAASHHTAVAESLRVPLVCLPQKYFCNKICHLRIHAPQQIALYSITWAGPTLSYNHFRESGGRSGFSLGGMAGAPLLRAPWRHPVSDVSLPRFPRSLNAEQARAAIPNEVSMFTGNALLG